MKNLFRIAAPAAAVLALLGCEPKVDDPGFDRGSLDVSRYLAIGDSYTANVTNNGLYQAGQEQSYAAIISDQLERVGGSNTFRQPFLPDAGTGHFRLQSLGQNGQPEVTFVRPTAYSQADFYRMADCPFADSLFFLPHATTPVQELNNLGIPLLRYQDLRVRDLGNRSATSVTVNPYLERLLPANDTSSYQTIAVAAKPTFFTIWLGTDEVLGYALAGGKRGTCDLPDRTTITNTFPKLLEGLLNALEANGGKGIVGEVPRIVDFPYFKQLNNAQLISQARQATNDTTATIYITASNGTARALNAAREIILPEAAALLGQGSDQGNLYGYSQSNAIAAELVLDLAEVNRITGAVNAYNDEIRRVLRKRLNTTVEPAAQINSVLTSIQNQGLVAGGVQYSNNNFAGGLFSLDGVHFSHRGNALIANAFIDKANQLYNANIPRVDPNAYPTSLKP